MAKNRQQLIREARDAALEHFRDGKHAAALERFSELERLEPTEADWPRRAAECQRERGNLPQQVAALGRAAELYARAGAMAKAIAMCRMILSIDPKHTQTQERLAALQQAGAAASPPRLPIGGPSLRAPEPRASDARAPEVRAPEAPLAAQAAVPTAPVPPAPAISSPAPQGEPQRPRPELGRLLRKRYIEQKKPASGVPLPGVTSMPPARVPSEPTLPFLAEGSLKDLVPNSQSIRDPRGMPSGMFRIDVGEIKPSEPVDRSRQMAQQALPTTPIFSELGPRSLERLIAKARLDHFEPGAAVYRQGDPAQTLYVIVSGTVAVIAEQAERIELSRLSEGEFFGESALMNNEPRQTTAEALEPTDVLTVDCEIIRELVADEPRLLKTVLRFLRERLIESSMLTNPLFTILSGVERRQLAADFEFVEIEPGSLVIWQGVRSPGLFVLLSGIAEVVHDDAVEERVLATLRPGAVFGEMSLLDGGAAVADVRCDVRSYALMLPKADFARVASEYPPVVEFIRLLAESRRQENGFVLESVTETLPA